MSINPPLSDAERAERAESRFDYRMAPENTLGHTMMMFHSHAEDGRGCGFHNRLGMWIFDDDKQCLRSHTLGYTPVEPCSQGHRIDDAPSLPYPEPDGTATQGHSGSETSRERAVEDAASGTATERQRLVLSRLRVVEEYGITVKELRERTGWHHGVASSVLSVLHKDGKIARLKDRRDRCQIYVHRSFVNGRETQPHGGRKQQDVAPYEVFEAGWKACNPYKSLQDCPAAYASWKAQFSD